MREEKHQARELIQRAREERGEAKEEEERLREERDRARDESRRAKVDKERLESKVALMQERCDRLSRRIRWVSNTGRPRILCFYFTSTAYFIVSAHGIIKLRKTH